MANELIAEAITDYFGERCIEYAEGCPTCEAWAEYDRLTHPAAPVGGLERYKYNPYSNHGCSSSLMEINPTGEYVRFDQAEAIIAAVSHTVECQRKCIVSREADNAALTARVKELEGEVFHTPELGITWKQMCEQYNKECAHHQDRAERYRKALEEIAHPKALTSLSKDKARAALEGSNAHI